MPTARLFAQFAAQNSFTESQRHSTVGAAQEGTVYAHGAWDLLSMGDIEFFASARAMGKRLVVGVIADDDVCKNMSNNSRRLKGQRPFQPFLTAVPSDNHFPVHSVAERALALMACKHVDDVLIGAPPVPDEEFFREENKN